MPKRILFVALLMICFFDAGAQDDLNSRLVIKLQDQLKSCKADTAKIGILISLYETELDRYPGTKRKTLLDSAYSFLREAKELNSKYHNHVPAQMLEIDEQERHFILGDTVEGRKSYLALAAKYHKVGDYRYETEAFRQLSDWFDLDDGRYGNSQLQWLSAAKNAAALTGDKILEGRIWYTTAKVHFFQKQLKLATSEANYALQLYQSAHAKVTQDIFSLIGDIQYASGNVPGAIDANLKAMDCINGTKDSIYYGALISKLMSLYAEHGMPKPALSWGLKSLHYDDSIGDHDDGHFIVIVSTVRIYLNIYGVKPSLRFLDSILKQTPPKTLRQTQSVDELYGKFYYDLKQYGKAEKYYKEMYSSFESDKTQTSNIEDYTYYNCLMAKFFYDTGQYDKADNPLNKMLNEPAAIQYRYNNRYKEVYMMKGRMDSTRGKYQSALHYLSLYHQVKDTLFNRDATRKFAEINVKYQTSERENTIYTLKEKEKDQQQALGQAEMRQYIFLSGVVVIMAFGAVLYIRYREKKRSNQMLTMKQQEINQKNLSLELMVSDQEILLAEKDKLLTEKDWLMKEVHHRVKNNLQLVNSLLSMQSAFLESSTAFDAIRESQNRVHTISLIHQKLYIGTDLGNIYMPVYVSELVNFLSDSFDTRTHSIRIENIVDDFYLDIAQTVPLGLILNEAITNAIKYAFDKTGGEIVVGLQLMHDELVILTITDNGVGLPKNFDPKNNNSLGMKIMKSLSKQLDGELQIKSQSGVKVSLEFYASL